MCASATPRHPPTHRLRRGVPPEPRHPPVPLPASRGCIPAVVQARRTARAAAQPTDRGYASADRRRWLQRFLQADSPPRATPRRKRCVLCDVPCTHPHVGFAEVCHPNPAARRFPCLRAAGVYPRSFKLAGPQNPPHHPPTADMHPRLVVDGCKASGKPILHRAPHLATGDMCSAMPPGTRPHIGSAEVCHSNPSTRRSICHPPTFWR
jgi:hypothetical protein